MPVSDAAARRAAAWLAAWHEAGLLGSDPEVVGFVEDLLNFVGEKTMAEYANNNNLYLDVCGALGWGYDPNSDPVPSILRAVPDLLTRVRELEAEVERLREGLRRVANAGAALEWATSFTAANEWESAVKAAAELLGGAE